jgi:hypothetical protein
MTGGNGSSPIGSTKIYEMPTAWAALVVLYLYRRPDFLGGFFVVLREK